LVSAIPLGKESRSNPLVFSLVSRCQDDLEPQEYTGAPSAAIRHSATFGHYNR